LRLIARVATAALVIGVLAAPAGAQQVVVRRAGPARAAAVLARVLAWPHTLIPPDTAPADLAAGQSYPQGVVVLGRDVLVNGTVHGSVATIGGDIYLHPGARIEGRAVAIGGAVYPSSLATVSDSMLSYRDFSYDIERTPQGYTLDYESRRVEHHGIAFPSWLGFSAPSYDRTDGLSIPIGLDLGSMTGRVDVEPSVIYRSELGRLDPQVTASGNLDDRTALALSAGRATLTNDGWIRSDLANSLETLLLGEDARNYFRGNFAEARVTRTWTNSYGTIAPFLGVHTERDAAVRPAPFATGGPWSLLGKTDSDRILRPNPQVPAGDIKSVLGGAAFDWLADGITTRLVANEEVGEYTPRAALTGPSATIAQTTVDATVSFPTFGAQSLKIHGHGVLTTGDPTPLERFAYVGGAGSISTIDMLALGGDELLFFDSRYAIPLSRIVLPFVGAPTLILRHVIGSAGIRQLPSFEQAVGLRGAAKGMYGEVMVDPASHHVHLGAGISLNP